ncbi:MAG: bifunctional aspartate kinase/homoserine dehydrogenase I [Bacteroidales bacterium OttesenSCG-928-I14]|jgi:aspartokinase/homoserine dehydrogenase 1|nr:bifunctional aspartate kinase/homoserine dehydrogenase I [Bacteroidales bacterium OttesenSCG-928-I14]
MKVLKFGGTSICCEHGILNIKKIIKTINEPVIIVLSALEGITEQLIENSKIASEGNNKYEKKLSEITIKHIKLIEKTIPYKFRIEVENKVLNLINELLNILKGVCMIKDLSIKTTNTIISYGVRISSLILSYIIEDAQLFDSLKFIKTKKCFNKHIVDFELTNQLIKNTFMPLPKISLVAGFISSDKKTNEITNLGHKGADYTASILAAALDASILEIWTDIDGFMSADPKIISSAYVIEHLTFNEAIELCNYGSKVIYPPTIYPVYKKNIPIRILNTFNINTAGTYISNKKKSTICKSQIKGISSIDDTCLITIQGLGMIGSIGINYRIFKALANNNICVFMISHTSSKNNTSFAVYNSDTYIAVKSLKKEFALELKQGEIGSIKAEKKLATIAIVGENMKQTPGIAGKLFGTLGRAGISVIACAQGASETNISFIIKLQYLHKALNSIHDSFFLSEYKVLNLFIIGIGTVGKKLLEQIRIQKTTLMEQNSLNLRVIGIANSKKCLFCIKGLNLNTCVSDLNKNGVNSSANYLLKRILELNIFNSVFIDCTASKDIATLYLSLLKNNISVVAANKIATSSKYNDYLNLKEIARQRDIKFLFETNVGAGLPIINTINNLINSGDQILRMEAVLSGTLNFIFNTLSKKISFSKAILMAKEANYSEPDPRIDLSGCDVIRKLVILTREAGYRIEQKDVNVNLFIPKKYFYGSLTDFWENIKKLDAKFEIMRKQVEFRKKRIRFVAKMEKGICEIGLQEVDNYHPFYELEGSNNIIMISTKRYNDYPIIIKGYGAGDDVTAAGVFADIISVANIR